MSKCSSCGGGVSTPLAKSSSKYSRTASAVPTTSVAPMLLRASSSLLQDNRGRPLTIDRSLVKGQRRPPGGWKASVRINGVDHQLTGNFANDVAKKLADALRRNDIKFTAADVWLTLNLQWMAKMSPDYFEVTQEALTKLIIPEEKAAERTSQRKSYSPKDWGGVAWKWLGLLLAQDQYSPEEFLAHLETTLNLLNPSINPTIGCIECYTEFVGIMQSVRHNVPADRAGARKWLWETHNNISKRIGKMQLTFDQAAAANYWT